MNKQGKLRVGSWVFLIIACILIILLVSFAKSFSWWENIFSVVGVAIACLVLIGFILSSKQTKGTKTAMILLTIFFAIGLISFIYGFETPTEQTGIIAAITTTIKSGLSLADAGFKSLFGENFADSTKKVIGYRDTFSSSLWINFFKFLIIGLIAGFLGYLGYTFERVMLEKKGEDKVGRLVDEWGDANIIKAPLTTREQIGEAFSQKSYKKATWLYFSAGGIYKIFVFAIVFAALMQVAFVNRFLEIITFYHFVNWFVYILIISIYFFFGPAILESLLSYRKQWQAQKAVMMAKVKMKMMRG